MHIINEYICEYEFYGLWLNEHLFKKFHVQELALMLIINYKFVQTFNHKFLILMIYTKMNI